MKKVETYITTWNKIKQEKQEEGHSATIRKKQYVNTPTSFTNHIFANPSVVAVMGAVISPKLYTSSN
jgi:hypothetical protein